MDTIEKAIQRLDRIGPNTPFHREVAGDDEGIENRISREASKEGLPTPQSSSTASVSGSKPDKLTKRSMKLDLERIRNAGMLVPDDKRSLVKEEFRHIKRPLLMNASGRGASVAEYPNLIMVTSARSGEGKTYTAISLALSIASELDQTVLLVDADVIKPMLSRFFGLDAEPGLVDFLIDDRLDFSDILVETDIPSFKILPAGHTHHLATELLASNSMRELAQEISKRYSDRIIIFDSPPLLLANEASVLASLMGQIVMVVEAEKTRQAHVKQALAMLDPNMNIGFVLNKARGSSGYGYYGYGYHGYGYYGYHGHEG